MVEVKKEGNYAILIILLIIFAASILFSSSKFNTGFLAKSNPYWQIYGQEPRYAQATPISTELRSGAQYAIGFPPPPKEPLVLPTPPLPKSGPFPPGTNCRCPAGTTGSCETTVGANNVIYCQGTCATHPEICKPGRYCPFNVLCSP